VHNDLAGLLVQLTPLSQEPDHQLLAGVVRPVGNAVGKDRIPVAHEWYPAEPGYQGLLAVAFDAGFEARSWPVRRVDGGLVFGRHLAHRGLVLGRQRLEHRRLGDPVQSPEPQSG